MSDNVINIFGHKTKVDLFVKPKVIRERLSDEELESLITQAEVISKWSANKVKELEDECNAILSRTNLED